MDRLNTVNECYAELVDKIICTGYKVDSRFGETLELRSQQFTFIPGEILARRGQNIKVGWVELVQLIAGIWDPAGFRKYAPNSEQSLFTEMMAYGPRTIGQIAGIVRTLQRDAHNRECYAFIGRPGESGTPSLPCTLGIHFLVRDGKLCTNAMMRSLDVLKGLPVDVFLFGGLAQVVADCLEMPWAECTVTACSAHVYTADIEAAKFPLPRGKVRTFTLPKFTEHSAFVLWALNEARWNWNDIPEHISLISN